MRVTENRFMVGARSLHLLVRRLAHGGVPLELLDHPSAIGGFAEDNNMHELFAIHGFLR
jgi:hypothetical protein